MRRRYQTATAPSEAVFVVLTFGWAALEHGMPGLDLIDVEHALNDEAGRALWQRWRTAVLGEAVARGIARPLWAEVEFDHAR